MGVRNYLIEGVSGAGKTTVCDELGRRGFHAVHGDRELAYQGDPATGRPVDGTSGIAAHAHHLWDEERVRRIASDASEPVTFFCGGSRNVDAFRDVFDDVFVLTVDADTLRSRLDERAEDEWAGVGRDDERALVLRLHETGTDLPTGIAIDATAPPDAVADDVLRRCDVPGRRT